jgi:hypothetical protein
MIQGEDLRTDSGSTKASTGEANAGASNVGVKFKLKPAIMVGILAQLFDQLTDAPFGPPIVSEQRWLVGPVTSLQLAPGLSFDARAAWGFAQTKGTALGLVGGRRLAEARLADTQAFGAWRLMPTEEMGSA